MGLDMYVERVNRKNSQIREELMYWRKFNALHNWFVQNVQGGVDDREMYQFNKEHIIKLVDCLKEILETENSDKFQPVSGFFFGSTEVDEYYWEEVKRTLNKFEELLQSFDWDGEWELCYQSSW